MRWLWLTKSNQGRDDQVAKDDGDSVCWTIQDDGIAMVDPCRLFGLTDPKAPPPSERTPLKGGWCS